MDGDLLLLLHIANCMLKVYLNWGAKAPIFTFCIGNDGLSHVV